MACHRKFVVRREDSDPKVVPGIPRRQHERGFRQVELLGDCLHDGVGKSVAVEKDRERISAEGAIGENINQVIRP